MKNVILAAVLSLTSVSAFANDSAPAATVPAAKAEKAVKSHKDKAPLAMSKVDAKKECAAEGKKGKELRSCVKGKMQPSNG